MHLGEGGLRPKVRELLKPGDIVQLREGSSPMRVLAVTTGYQNSVLVEWNWDDGIEVRTFPIGDLCKS